MDGDANAPAADTPGGPTRGRWHAVTQFTVPGLSPEAAAPEPVPVAEQPPAPPMPEAQPVATEAAPTEPEVIEPEPVQAEAAPVAAEPGAAPVDPAEPDPVPTVAAVSADGSTRRQTGPERTRSLRILGGVITALVVFGIGIAIGFALH